MANLHAGCVELFVGKNARLRYSTITAATDTSYMGQIRFEDRIAVTTCVERIGTKSLTLLQRIVADDGTVRSQSRSVMVAFDFEAQQSVPVPDAWRRALEAE